MPLIAWNELATTEDLGVLVDLDGTLIPFATTLEQAVLDDASAALLASLAARALPRDAALRAGRDFVPAEVVARPSKDECWLAVPELRGIALGAPVVCGDAYVGRVVELAPPAASARTGAHIRVQLVTAESFRVGAEVRGTEPIYLTAGGVRVTPRGRAARSLRLAAHQPSSDASDAPDALRGGIARVHELFADADASAILAEGFRLGALRRDGERDPWWIEPELDYLDGLFLLAVVVPPRSDDASGGAVAAAPSALADGGWLATRALTHGDPAPWRSTLKLPLGRADGLRAGAAVTGTGARLLGRVLRAGRATSDVALLADPGFSLPVVARFEGDDEPYVLGRVTALGRGEGTDVRMRWWVRVTLEVEHLAGAVDTDGMLRARLYSGSGDPGLPGGLFLGRARLPRAARAGEEHEILLEPRVDPLDVRSLFVRAAGEGLP
jgi:hypothetical protein